MWLSKVFPKMLHFLLFWRRYTQLLTYWTKSLELLDFWTLPISYSENNTAFCKWTCYHSQMKGWGTTTRRKITYSQGQLYTTVNTWHSKQFQSESWPIFTNLTIFKGLKYFILTNYVHPPLTFTTYMYFQIIPIPQFYAS